MIVDTLKSRHRYRPALSNDELLAIGARRIGNSEFPVWTINPKKGEPLPRITFLFPPSNFMYLTAEVSVPRFANGHNARLLNPAENDAAIEAIAEFVEERTGLDFDPFTATVSRVDYAIDIQLGEPVAYEAIKRLSQMKLKDY